MAIGNSGVGSSRYITMRNKTENSFSQEKSTKMMAKNAQVLGEIRYKEPLSRHTTWRVGGPAHEFFKPTDKDDLLHFLAQRNPEHPLLWLGLGSNLLVRDGGFRGTVISTLGCLDSVEVQGDRLVAEAGASCAKVARVAARNGLIGVEFLAGIPGTMGGGIGDECWCVWRRNLGSSNDCFGSG